MDFLDFIKIWFHYPLIQYYQKQYIFNFNQYFNLLNSITQLYLICDFIKSDFYYKFSNLLPQYFLFLLPNQLNLIGFINYLQ